MATRASVSTDFIAHARPLDGDAFEVHDVEEHLHGVADRAAVHAAPFGGSEWARVAGLWHDLGKYHPDFQRYIRKATGYEAHLEGAPGRVDHSTAGAVHAVRRFRERGRAQDLGRVLAYLIAGHHTGLPDWISPEQGAASLAQRLERQEARLDETLRQPLPDGLAAHPLPAGGPPPGTSHALWVRMLFACLVDADFLDTEQFLQPERTALRGGYPTLDELGPLLDQALRQKAAEARASPVNDVRASVLHRCRQAALLPPGIFSLTVPTGGGKTLSSLAFALDHARRHGKRRIIYVIPFTSIIEQTADVFRGIFGDAVVEHHSSLDSTRETPESRIAGENWDAPVIVTTAVQFFESLFAARTSLVRKLHNIADSVVVLDEVQLLPPAFLEPIVDALRDLAAGYGVSLVLCTATQPALEASWKTPDREFRGLGSVTPIIPDPDALHRTLRRVELHLPRRLDVRRTWEGVAAELAGLEESVLCIVNRRADARDLFRLLPEKGTIHLSGLMCGEHRSRVIKQIRQRLEDRLLTRVVSTQLVEAGVDLDFPVVYRALAGLDSIAQAAGRCNREGRLPGHGRVVVFVPPQPSPPGLLRDAERCGTESLAEGVADPLAPERFRLFFSQLYQMQGERLDRERIADHLRDSRAFEYRFRSAAEAFRIIDDVQQPVVVRYREGTRLIAALRARAPDRQLLRQTQRYVVNVPRVLHARLLADGSIEEVHPGIFAQLRPDLYHPRLGLGTGEEPYQSDTLIA